GTGATIVPAHLRGHPCVETGSTDAVESGNAVATICRHFELLQPDPRPRPAARARRSLAAWAHPGERRRPSFDRGNRAVPRRIPAALSRDALGGANRHAYRDVPQTQRG